MKLDLTPTQNEILENAADLIADLIEEHIQRKEDLLDKTYSSQGTYLMYLNEQIAALKSDIRELVQVKHSLQLIRN